MNVDQLFNLKYNLSLHGHNPSRVCLAALSNFLKEIRFRSEIIFSVIILMMQLKFVHINSRRWCIYRISRENDSVYIKTSMNPVFRKTPVCLYVCLSVPFHMVKDDYPEVIRSPATKLPRKRLYCFFLYDNKKNLSQPCFFLMCALCQRQSKGSRWSDRAWTEFSPSKFNTNSTHLVIWPNSCACQPNIHVS